MPPKVRTNSNSNSHTVKGDVKILTQNVEELQVSNEKRDKTIEEMQSQLTEHSKTHVKILETLERIENQSREQKSAPVIKSTPSGKEFKFDKKDYTRKQTKTIRELVLKSKKDISYDEDKLTDDEDKTYWIDLCLEHNIPPPPSVKSKKEKDPNAPKKALNIYMTFCQYYREQNPEQTFSTTEIKEIYDEKMKDPEEKAFYQKLTDEGKKRYESEIAKYKSLQDNTSSDSDSVSEKHLSAKPPSGRPTGKTKKTKKKKERVPEPEPEPEPQFEVVPDSSESSDENSDFEEAPPKKPISHLNLLDMSVEA